MMNLHEKNMIEKNSFIIWLIVILCLEGAKGKIMYFVFQWKRLINWANYYFKSAVKNIHYINKYISIMFFFFYS